MKHSCTIDTKGDDYNMDVPLELKHLSCNLNKFLIECMTANYKIIDK